jgi:N-acetylglucosaminyl-diphospho-decaprenol L-rhamnosyltransferase
VSESEPLLSIIVLSHDRPAYLRQALASLVAQSVADREILVVDNPSASSAEIATIVASFPEVGMHALSTNLGFTGGMNAGIAAARGRYVLLTEDDIVVEPGCLAALLEHSRSAGGRSVLAGIMLDHGTSRIRCAGGEISLGPPFRMEVIGADQDVSRARREPYHVSFLAGAFLFFPREALTLLGGFRSDYFIYWDDVELCLRARRLGIALVVVPDARLSHLPPGYGSTAPAADVHRIKNQLATYLLHAPLAAFPSVALRYVALESVRRARAGRGQFTAFLRAVGWTMLNAPRLLGERLGARP